MAIYKLLITLAVLTISLAEENVGMRNIGVAFWKGSGFDILFRNSTAMTERILTDRDNIENGLIEAAPALNGGVNGDDVNFINMGTEDITTIEREGANGIGEMMPQAGCALYDEVIEVPNNNPNAMIYPSCVAVKRCGGCCGHPALACRPTSTETITIKVMKYIYDGSIRPSSVLTNLELQAHTACSCGCRVQASDCNPRLHEYSERDCQCVCINHALAGSCPQGTRWNSQFCACQCSDVQSCGLGHYYDMATCSCRVGVGNSGSNNILTSGPRLITVAQPNNPVTEQVTANPCPHLKCQRNYEPSVSRGRCRCQYVSRSNRTGK